MKRHKKKRTQHEHRRTDNVRRTSTRMAINPVLSDDNARAVLVQMGERHGCRYI